jgi:hypothetical protein
MIFRFDSLGNPEQQYEVAQSNVKYFATMSSIIHDSSGSLFVTGLIRQMAYFGDSLVGYPNDHYCAFMGKIDFEGLYNGIPFFEEDKGVILIYPSFTREIIYVESYAENLANKELNIFDSAGGIVLQATLTSNRSEINISALSQGLYFVEIQGKDFHETHKIVKY